MKKLTILSALLLNLNCSYAQVWKSSDTTSWIPIDTFDKRYSDAPMWIEGPWKEFPLKMTIGDTIIVEVIKQRVGQKSGILQEKKAITKVLFPKTEKPLFDKIIDSISKP